MNEVQSHDYGTKVEWRKRPYNWEYQLYDTLLHREDGPARKRLNGFWSWWKNGKRHRLDGPALININNKSETNWFIEGIRYSYRDYIATVKPLISDEAYFILILTYGDSESGR